MQITLQPALTAGTTCGSISSRLLCVLMQTTSGFRARTASKSVVILTSHGRPSSSPTVFPSLAGLVTMTPQRSMSLGRSRMYPRRPWPIMPVPHSATLIMSHSTSQSLASMHKEYAVRDAHSTTVLYERRGAEGHSGEDVVRRSADGERDGRRARSARTRHGALRRGVLEEAGRPCRARGWKALCPSSLLGRSGAGPRTPTGAQHAMRAAGDGQPCRHRDRDVPCRGPAAAAPPRTSRRRPSSPWRRRRPTTRARRPRLVARSRNTS